MSDPQPPSYAERRREAIALEAALRSVRAAQAPPVAPTAAARRHARPNRSPVRAALRLAVVVATGLVLWGGFAAGGPDDDAAAGPYDRPPEFTPGEGAYRFLGVHPETAEPIGFDPCRPVRYVVNPDGAPPDWRELVATGIAHVEWASGLDFVNAGTTTLRPFDPARTDHALGEQPVVIGFSEETELPRLADDTIGLGGGVPSSWNGTYAWYGTGSIALDTEVFDGPSSGSERAFLQSVVDHELGHVVGLGPVDDPDQLMHSGPGGHAEHFGPGDLEGLAELASIPCQ